MYFFCQVSEARFARHLVALAAALTETENVRGREEEQQDERAKEPG